MKRALGIVLSTFLTSCATGGGDVSLSDVTGLACPAEPSPDSCQIYTCIEADRKCGEEGYPAGYGAHYCERFLNLCDGTLFTEAEKKWARASAQCLQTATNEAQYLSEECSAIADKSFEAHANCFTAGANDLEGPSLCALGPDSWRRLRRCFDLDDDMSQRGLAQLGATLVDCGQNLAEGQLEESAALGFVPDETVLKEWAKEAKTLGEAWLKEAE